MKKALTFLLVLAMLLTTACAKAPAEETTAPEAADTTAAAADTTAAQDEQLQTVTILCRSLNNNPEPNYRYAENPRWEKIPMVQKFYKMLADVGVRLEYEAIDDEQYDQAVKTRLQTGVDLPDIIADPRLTDVEAINLGESGISADVKALFEQYDEDGSILKYWQDMVGASISEITTEDGHIWWAPYTYHRDYLNDDRTVNPDHYDCSFHISVRSDWLKALGQEWEMFYTPDEMADMLIAMNKEDANGNDVQDEVIGNFNTKMSTGFEAGFDLVYGLVAVRNDGKGVQCNFYHENFPAYIEFMKKLYDNGCIDTTVLNGTNVIGANRASTVFDYCGEYWHERSIPGYEDTAVYSPIIIDDDDCQNGYILPMRQNKEMLLGKWFVNAASENLEAVVKVFDVLYTEEMAHLSTWGEEGVTYDLDEEGNIIKRSVDGENHDPNVLTTFICLTNNALPNVYDCRETRTGYLRTQAHIPQWADKDTMIAWVYDHDTEGVFQESMMPFAMMTNEERQVIEKTEATLMTYVDEMILGLITGEKSMDDFDTYLAEMEALGLKEYIGVFEARHARWVEYANENNLDTIYD